MSKLTPDFIREFSFKDWFEKFNSGASERSNEKLYKQAIYNVLASSLMVIFSVATWGVLMILQPFLKPLLWSLLCGSVLHPLKNRVAKRLNECIEFLDHSSLIHPLAYGISSPILLNSYLTDILSNFVRNHLYVVVTILSLAAFEFVIPVFSGPSAWNLCCSFFSSLFLVRKLCCNSIMVTSAVGCFSWFLFFKRDLHNKWLLTSLSMFTWFVTLCYLTSFCSILKVPIFLGLVALFLCGFVTEYLNSNEESAQEAIEETSNGAPIASRKQSQISDSPTRDQTISQRRHFSSQLSFMGLKKSNISEHTGDQYLFWVCCACAFVFFRKWWWTPYIVGLQIIFFVTKKLYNLVGIHGYAYDSITYYTKLMSSQIDEEKINIIFPLPLMNTYKLLISCKKKLLKIIRESCDAISTIIVILSVIVFVVVASLFLIMQVYTEGMYLVKVGSKVLNDTIISNEQFHNIVPENWENQLDSAFENAYTYGRDFISKMVRKMLNGIQEEDKINELERFVLELWDRIYQAWLASNAENIVGPKVTSDAVYQIWDSFTLNILKTSEIMNMNTIMQFLNNNMTTLSSAVKNIWDFIVDNVGLVVYLLQASLSLVFMSGSAVFSFFIDLVIFLTALFYLLSSSSDVYKPVECIAKLSSAYGNKLAVAIERSVSEVFMVSTKLSVFYGLYTWFLHNLFQMQILYVPTVTAAILAAIPVLPTFVVCIPGVLDLWLIQENSISAILLFALQFAPTYFVDAAIYEDIQGGHPYLTGLAMAGGVLYFGVEGAIIGPLILCFMLVIINFCASLMQEPTESSLIGSE